MDEKKYTNYKKCVLHFEGGKIVISGQYSYVNKNGVNVTVGAHAKIIGLGQRHHVTIPIKDYVEMMKIFNEIENDPKARKILDEIKEYEKKEKCGGIDENQSAESDEASQ